MNEEGERCDDNLPDTEESKKVWGGIWSEFLDRKRDGKWLKYLQSEVNVKNRREI